MRDLLLYGQTGAAASTVVNGHLQAERVEILEGTLGGRNRVTANEIVIGANASIGPGNSPGKLTIDGTLFVDGTLELEISPNASDQLEVTGNVIFNEGARVRFVFLDGLVPQTGQRFSFADFVTAPYGILGLGNVGFQLGGLPSAGYETRVRNKR